MNAVFFIPFGIYVSGLFGNWSFGKKFLSFACVSLAFEVLQFIFAIGRTDITDLIENCLGGVAGILLYALLGKLCRPKEKADRH